MTQRSGVWPKQLHSGLAEHLVEDRCCLQGSATVHLWDFCVKTLRKGQFLIYVDALDAFRFLPPHRAGTSPPETLGRHGGSTHGTEGNLGWTPEEIRWRRDEGGPRALGVWRGWRRPSRVGREAPRTPSHGPCSPASPACWARSPSWFSSSSYWSFPRTAAHHYNCDSWWRKLTASLWESTGRVVPLT